jgi:hypothetical protein
MRFGNDTANRFVVDTSHLDREQQIGVCRTALEHVASAARQFQCDVPWDRQDGWPSEVREAAAELVEVHYGYQLSGWIRDFPPAKWQAFVTYAPFCYDSDVWSEDMGFLAGVHDEGSSLVVRIVAGQVWDFQKSVAGATVVPLAMWRRRAE